MGLLVAYKLPAKDAGIGNFREYEQSHK